jgi:hypothetical protein
MSWAFGLGESSKSRFYQGWYNDATVRYLPESQYQEVSRIEWETLGTGDDLFWALYDAIWDSGTDARNNYRLKGQGFLTDIVLSGN